MFLVLFYIGYFFMCNYWKNRINFATFTDLKEDEQYYASD